MKPVRSFLVAAALAASLLPVVALAADAASPPAGGPEVEERLKAARQRLEEAAREVAQLSGQLGRNFQLRIGGMPGDAPVPRALIGVNIDNASGRDGAHVVNVSPGSPAAEAGIKPGDVITSIAGADLTKDSDPSRALVEKMAQVEPNLKLQVGVLRDGKKMDFDVTPRPAPPITINLAQGVAPPVPVAPGMPPAPGVRRFELQRIEPQQPAGPEGLEAFRGMLERAGGPDTGARFQGMEFATLSERLGSYFGVKAGVLVVRAGMESPFKLQDGDVILAIDGREATSAQHAGRILRSYQPGEKLTLRVQRDRKAINIEVNAPGGRN